MTISNLLISKFQHRDLHEGQILLQSVPIDQTSFYYTQAATTGIQATIIDFGLSRLDMGDDQTAWTPLPEDVYDGVGDQWDVYRQMRDKVNGDWVDFHPVTNVMVGYHLLVRT
jgi:serine/threonine-protein kinase haspin